MRHSAPLSNAGSSDSSHDGYISYSKALSKKKPLLVPPPRKTGDSRISAFSFKDKQSDAPQLTPMNSQASRACSPMGQSIKSSDDNKQSFQSFINLVDTDVNEQKDSSLLPLSPPKRHSSSGSSNFLRFNKANSPKIVESKTAKTFALQKNLSVKTTPTFQDL
mmetsp:Transcript_12666/g.19686  ORF Transcript_12666/g.19686 Transcript_12666/m.19686 type:complete len:163 (+) Transcript_12666:537-1025(+)